MRPVIAGVVFDLEDTLVVRRSYQADVDRLVLEAIAQAQGCGAKAAHLLFQEIRYCSPTALAAIEALGVTKNQLHARLDEVVLSKPVVPMPGVPDILYHLIARGLRLGLVTNMARGLAHRVLSSAGVSCQLFAAIVTGSDVVEPKPATEPFRLAMALMALRPEQCLMIGDREEVDLDPAKRLGMMTALVGNAAVRADHTLTSLLGLRSLLQE
jgi:FMN phosphatase YigB (HAD superfamily)